MNDMSRPKINTGGLNPCSSRYCIGVLAFITVLGIALRLCISFYSIGIDDAVAWANFAEEINSKGLFEAYRTDILLNHPPLIAEWSALMMRWTAITDQSFYFLFRLLPIAADIGSCLLLRSIIARRYNNSAGWCAAAAFAWGLDAILVSAYHGNTDNIYAFLALLAVYCIEQRKSCFYGGLVLAAAINVKLIPIILLVPLFLLCRRTQEKLCFLGGVSLGVIPFLYCLINMPGFYTHVLGYNPESNIWGIILCLNALKMAASQTVLEQPIASIIEFYAHYGRYFVLISIIIANLIAVRLRMQNGYILASVTMALFLILTPSFAIQYSVAVLPLMFAVNVRAGALYALASGVFLAILYGNYWTGMIPAFSNISVIETKPLPRIFVVCGLFVWVGLIYYVKYWFLAFYMRQEPLSAQER